MDVPIIVMGTSALVFVLVVPITVMGTSASMAWLVPIVVMGTGASMAWLVPITVMGTRDSISFVGCTHYRNGYKCLIYWYKHLYLWMVVAIT